MLVGITAKPAYDVLIPKFERVFPNIKIDITYAPSTNDLYQLETVELAAAHGPDLLTTQPGSGTPVSVTKLAKAGYLAPMIAKPWVRRSLPLITSADKYGAGLFSFTPALSFWGVFTNDDLFRKLGLKVPQTFAQLLRLCQKATAAGTAALVFPGGSPPDVAAVVLGLAVATVYGRDKHWASEQRRGTKTFGGSPGWHEAFQELVDMNGAGCFQPGATGTTRLAAFAQFAQGQALMVSALTASKGTIDAAGARFRYSHHPFPAAGADPHQIITLVNPGDSVGVNAHSSAQNQAAAQRFVDFIAQTQEDALYAETTGYVTQAQFLKRSFPPFMRDDSSELARSGYVLNPGYFWWNPNVVLAFFQNVVGVLTGQRSINDVLNAMDAAWKLGPA